MSECHSALRCVVVVPLLLSLYPLGVLATDGSLDPGFGGDGRSYYNFGLDSDSRDLVSALAVQRDGKVIVVGSVSDNDGEVTKLAAVRIGPDGTLDTGFGDFGRFVLDLSSLGLTWTQGRAAGVALDGAGRAVIVGSVSSAGVSHPLLVRLTTGGSLDGTFFGDGVEMASTAGTANAVAVDRYTGVVWALGTSSTDFIWTWRWAAPAGTPVERIWSVPGSDLRTGRALVVQPDGKPVLGGRWLPTGTLDMEVYVTRLLAAGNAPDTSFGGSGSVYYGFDLAPPEYVGDELIDLTLDSRGRILVLTESEVGPGSFEPATDLGILRLQAHGALDPTFAGDGTTTVSFYGAGARDAWYEGRIVAQGDRKIVIGATPGVSPFDVRAGALRLLANGSPDLHFGGGGNGQIIIDLEPDGGPSGSERCGFSALGLEAGRVFGAGASEWSDPDYDFGFARLTNSYLFADGFEVGSAWFWSAVLH